MTELCGCHNEPMYWQRDTRIRNNGWWRCAVKARDLQRERYHSRYRDRKLRQQRERYDLDPVYRIEKRLHDDAHDRHRRISRRRAELTREREGCSG